MEYALLDDAIIELKLKILTLHSMMLQLLVAQWLKIELAHLDLCTLSTSKQLPYLTAYIQEGLQFSCGVSSRLQRICPDEDLVFKDGDNNGRYVVELLWV